MSDRDPDANVELGELVDAKDPKGRPAVLAVRVSSDLLERLTDYARLRGLTVSEVVRRAAEQLTAGGITAGPVYYTGAELRGPGLIHGSPATGSARISSEPQRSGKKSPALTTSA